MESGRGAAHRGLFQHVLHVAWPHLLLAGIGCLRAPDVRHIVLGSFALLYGLALYGADPIVGQFMRHFLTPLALLLPLSCAGLCVLVARVARIATVRRLVTAVMLWTTISAFLMNPLLIAWAQQYGRRAQARQQLAAYLASQLRPEHSYVIGDAGLVPYRTPQRVWDAYCLNDAGRPPDGPAAGPTARRFLAHRPEAIVVHSTRADRLAVPSVHGFYPALLAEPAFQDGYRYAASFGASGDDLQYFVYRRVGR